MFEHIALVVHLDDLEAWDRFLRESLGGKASMGAVARRAGFQGGQVTFPDRGMIELLTWTDAGADGSANKRFLDRLDRRASLHHLTFLVDDFEAAIKRCEDAGYKAMVGRGLPNWEEFFVKDPSLLPPGLLVQVLRADKDALVEQGWRQDWEPFTRPYPRAESPVRVEGVHLACRDEQAASRLFIELLGGELDGNALRFPDSSMRVWLHQGEAADFGYVEISAPRDPDPIGAGLFQQAGNES